MNLKHKKQKEGGKEAPSKPLILYFIIVLGIFALLILAVSVFCFGIVHLSNKEEKLYIDNLEVFLSRDIAIVPGANVNSNAPSAKGADRLNAAIRLYEEGLVDTIVVSGGMEEVEIMVMYLLLHQIPETALVSDEYGNSTYEMLARMKEAYPKQSFYVCTQELYVDRVQFLARHMEMDCQSVCVDTMQYNNPRKSVSREYFTATKAVLDCIFYDGKPKNTVKEKKFSKLPEIEEDASHLAANVIELPEDLETLDENPKDNYDVKKAVEYAREYALQRNPEYPCYEQNCVNFVSQCLLAGGIEPQGAADVSSKERFKTYQNENFWFSCFALVEQHGHNHYTSSFSFLNTEAFIRYFTEKRGYQLTIYANSYDGKLDYFENAVCGDVYILYDAEGGINHIGIITGIGDRNVYYCANTSDKKDYSAFNISEILYPQIGILHMSQ